MDFVWDVLTRDRFHVGEYNKLKYQKIEPCEVLQKINDNTFRLFPHSHLQTFDVFNIKHLNPYFVDAEVNSRVSSFQFRDIGAGEFESYDTELTNSTLITLNYLKKSNQHIYGRKM